MKYYLCNIQYSKKNKNMNNEDYEDPENDYEDPSEDDLLDMMYPDRDDPDWNDEDDGVGSFMG